MGKKMKVKIENIPSGEGYKVSSKKECKDSIDEMIFELVELHNDVVKIGKTIGYPI